MKKPVLIIMAAGLGSRYGGLKQLDPVGGHGELIIDYSIYDARRPGFETVIFVIKPENEADFRARIGDRVSRHMDVRYVYQRKDDLPEGFSVLPERQKPWGTAHAVLSARGIVDGPFAVINSDDYYGPEAYQEIFEYLSSHPDGVCQETPDRFLSQITERTKITKGPPLAYTEDDGQTWTELPEDTVISLNLWGFTRSFLDEAWARFPVFLDKALRENPNKAEYYLPSVVSQLIGEDKARVKVLRSEDKWYGVTYREDKPSVTAALAEKSASGLYPENLWA